MMTEPIVENVHDRLDKNVQQHLKCLDESACVIPDGYLVMTSAICLGQDFTKYDNGTCGDDNS